MKRILLALTVGVLLAGKVFADGTTNAPPVLTLADAQKLALQNHPQIAAANYRALAAQEVVKETRAGYFPTRQSLCDRRRRGFRRHAHPGRRLEQSERL